MIFLKKIVQGFLNQPESIRAFFYGTFCGISFEPTRNVITFLIGFLGILHLLTKNTQTLKQCVRLTSIFFYGYFFISLHWIQFCFLSLDLGFVIPITLIFFPLIFIFFTLWCGPFFYFNQYLKSFPLIFALSFWVIELMIGHLCTGFPWVLSSYILPDYSMQGGAYIGAYGMSLVFLIWCSQFYKARKRKCVILIASFLALNAFGYYRVNTTMIEKTDKNIRLLHPHILQKNKMDANLIRENFEKQLDLYNDSKDIHLFIWPEATLPLPFNQYPFFMHHICEDMTSVSFSIVGAPFISKEKFYTSAYIFNREGSVNAIYHKNHLVPFGEYLPFRFIFEKFGFKKVTAGTHDYDAGYDKTIYKLPSMPSFSVLICYEIIFPNQLFDEKLGKPEFLVNMTNDAWFMQSAGVHQHLHMVRWRAIEEGMPIARCANMGFSCLINAVGIIEKSLSPIEVGYLDVVLSKPLQEETFYQKLRQKIRLWF